MRSSNIGGQAVLEGIMMKHKDRYAIAVRKPDGEIEVEVREYAGIFPKAIRKIPFVRGIFTFVDSLVLGLRALMYSASFYDEEEEKELTDEQREEKEKKESALMTATMVVSVILAIAIFVALPYAAAYILRRFVTSQTLLAFLEGVIRLAIFLIYMAAVAQMEDIRRTFMYHGAEHKCINCIEHGLDLTVENVRVSSRQHKRCGTSFLLFVMLIGIVLLLFVRAKTHLMRIVIRLLLIPVVAGIAYEVIRLAGRSDNPLVWAVSRPGLWLQKLTTKEPTDDMIEVGIRSVEAVFDWRAYQREVFGGER